MFARLGFPVRKLKCIEIGPLSLHKLPLGAARRLSPRELAALRAAMDASNEEARTQRRRRKPTPGGPPARPSSTAAPKTTKPTDSRPRRRVIT